MFKVHVFHNLSDVIYSKSQFNEDQMYWVSTTPKRNVLINGDIIKPL